MTPLAKLPRGTLAALERAVAAMASWEGYYIGNPEAHKEFLRELAAAKAALKAVREQQKAIHQVVSHVMVELVASTSLH